jgi:dTDP-glucose 4,6-dehydratase
MREYKNIIVTGGSGFIGANFIRYILTETDYKGRIVNVDKLTYAGNPENLEDIVSVMDESRYVFSRTDICDFYAIDKLFAKYEVDCVIHFAAESHVDRSIHGPGEFVRTNINGTFNLLEVARKHWVSKKDTLFHHVSTDEVYGSLGDTGHFFENTPYDPRSPYSSSKAASDHLVNAYYHTYGMNITMSNCTNNYGPYQFPEKLIPVMVMNILADKELPIYGDGQNIRDWLYVIDHNTAIWKIVTEGRIGETYNIGGENEWTNLDLVNYLCELMSELKGKPEKDYYKKLITYVKDRPGHDRRYAINCDKIKSELGWKQSVTFAEGLKKTTQWYLDNDQWVGNIKSGAYQEWLDKNYGER